jgi:hypothetical protein
MNFAAHVQKPVIGAAFPQGKQVKEEWVNGFSPSDGLERCASKFISGRAGRAVSALGTQLEPLNQQALSDFDSEQFP